MAYRANSIAVKTSPPPPSIISRENTQPINAFCTAAHDKKIFDLLATLDKKFGSQLSLTRQERPNDGTIRYILQNLRSDVNESRIVETVEKLHRRCNRCQFSLDTFTIGLNRQRGVLIEYTVPVPWTIGYAIRVIIISLIFLLSVWLAVSGWNGVHTQWHGKRIPWIGIEL
jgi:hypothetical protein